MTNSFTESVIEQVAIGWLKDLGYNYAFGPEIVFDGAVCTLARLQDGPSMPKLMKREVRVSDVEKA